MLRYCTWLLLSPCSFAFGEVCIMLGSQNLTVMQSRSRTARPWTVQGVGPRQRSVRAQAVQMAHIDVASGSVRAEYATVVVTQCVGPR